MYIAEQLKKKSVAEYLLYMWQVEDTLRAYDLDVERMAREYIPQFGLDAEKSEALRGWYESLIEMMRTSRMVSPSTGEMSEGQRGSFICILQNN